MPVKDAPAGDAAYTTDGLYGGRLELRQPERGYRFSVDSPLLTWFASSGRTARLCADLGAGCGVVGLGLLAAGAARRVVGVEIQPALAAACRRNARANGLDGSYELVEGDMAEPSPHMPAGEFDLVACNPPFWDAAAGLLPEDEERRIACHEVAVSLDGWVGAAARLLHPRRGRLCAVFPARRLDELLSSLADRGLSCARLLPVHPSPDAPAEIVLVEARDGGAGRMEIRPGLALRGSDGTDTPQLRQIVEGGFSAALRSRTDRRGAPS